MPTTTKARPVPRQERSRRTVNNLLDAAVRVFDRDGFSASTMTAVAAEAGVGIASLYAWFPSKDDLVAGLTERHLNDSGALLARLAERLRADLPDAVTVVTSYVDAVLESNSGPSAFHRELFDRFPRTDEVLALLGALEGASIDEVAFHLDRLGLGRSDVRLTATVLTKTVETLVHDVVLAARAGRARQRARAELICLVLAYLGAEKA